MYISWRSAWEANQSNIHILYVPYILHREETIGKRATCYMYILFINMYIRQ